MNYIIWTFYETFLQNKSSLFFLRARKKKQKKRKAFLPTEFLLIFSTKTMLIYGEGGPKILKMCLCNIWMVPCDIIRYILKDAIFWINPDLHDQLQLFNGLSYFAATPILFLLSHDWSTEKTAFLAALRTRLLAMLARWNLQNTLLFFASLCSIWFLSILLLRNILP